MVVNGQDRPDPVKETLVELRVELRGLEPLTPCLQIAFSSCRDATDLGQRSSSRYR